MANLIKMGQGTAAGYATATKDQYQVYFTTDTHQIFVGADEYTKGTKTLGAKPTSATAGDKDRLYFVDNELYLCGGETETAGVYSWTRVANIQDAVGTVTSVAAGDGLETADGEAITASGTIKHAVPTGATTVTDPTSATGNIEFGGTFDIQGIATDKFGHVTSSTKKTLTMPTETAVTVTGDTAASQTLSYGDTLTVITGVGMSTASGATNHDVVATTTTFTLPSSDDTTYAISSVSEGVVTLTDSNANATTALINGWNDLAKKSDITAVFKFRGVKATAAELPDEAVVGDVWAVTADESEYVCTVAGTGSGSPATWEKLGPIVDLSAYATTAYVDEKLTWQTF